MDLEQAINLILIELTTLHKSISAYDVTQELRKRVKQSTLTLLGATDFLTVDGITVPRIEHTDVRGIVHALFDTGIFPNYTRISNGTYWVYGYEDPDTSPPAVPGGSYDGTPTL